MSVLEYPREVWTARQDRHHRLVDELSAAHLERRRTGRKHPVEDFLWVYYRLTPARLRRWHPGAAARLRDVPASDDRTQWKYYRENTGAWQVDVPTFVADHGPALARTRQLLRATRAATPQWGCFGLHEWAMVYRIPESDARHPWPLRLGVDGTARVVDSHALRCTHFDAYRFFTPDAAPRNAVALTRELQLTHEQPACIHATMDLYKWAYRLGPLVPGELLLACLSLARAARTLDMRASAYDLTALGYPHVPIETAAGKAQYLAGQRAIAAAGEILRGRLLRVLDDVHAAAPLPSPTVVDAAASIPAADNTTRTALVPQRDGADAPCGTPAPS